MEEKNNVTFTRADLIIVKHFGPAVEEYYGDKYQAISKYLQDIENSTYKDIDTDFGDDFIENTIQKIKPLVDSIVEKNKKSKSTFARLKEMAVNNNNAAASSLVSIIESVENGIQGVITSANLKKKNIFDSWKVFDLLSSSDGLKLIPAGATRGEVKVEVRKNLPFKYITEKEPKQSYYGELVHEEDTIKVIINCNDINKEFFLISQGLAISESPKDGRIEFIVPDKGDYLLTDDGQGFMAFSLK